MKRKEKIYCDKCGRFIRDLSGEELRKADQERFKGTRISYEAYCNKCDKENN